VFHSKDVISLVSCELAATEVLLVDTYQVFKDLYWLRVGELDLIDGVSAHQGIFVRRDIATANPFSLNRSIDADLVWIKSIIERSSASSARIVACDFMLGGLSNFPTLKSVRIRLSQQGPLSALKELCKMLVRIVLGSSCYYRILSYTWAVKYRRLSMLRYKGQDKIT
jgi:hypothetical protein